MSNFKFFIQKIRIMSEISGHGARHVSMFRSTTRILTNLCKKSRFIAIGCQSNASLPVAYDSKIDCATNRC